MDRFEFVFSLIGLLLGLSLVEVLHGLVKARKARLNTRIGWLTPMLGVFVMLHVTSFWGITWSLRELLPSSIWPTLGVGVLLSGAYYLSASAVFPTDPDQVEDLDGHYWQHKREVFAIILGISLAVQVIALVLGRPLTPLAIGINLPLFSGMAIACFSKSRRADLVLIGAMIVISAANFAIP